MCTYHVSNICYTSYIMTWAIIRFMIQVLPVHSSYVIMLHHLNLNVYLQTYSQVLSDAHEAWIHLVRPRAHSKGKTRHISNPHFTRKTPQSTNIKQRFSTVHWITMDASKATKPEHTDRHLWTSINNPIRRLTLLFSHFKLFINSRALFATSRLEFHFWNPRKFKTCENVGSWKGRKGVGQRRS